MKYLKKFWKHLSINNNMRFFWFYCSNYFKYYLLLNVLPLIIWAIIFIVINYGSILNIIKLVNLQTNVQLRGSPEWISFIQTNAILIPVGFIIIFILFIYRYYLFIKKLKKINEYPAQLKNHQIVMVLFLVPIQIVFLLKSSFILLLIEIGIFLYFFLKKQNYKQ